MKELLNKMNKTHYLSLIIFFIGYLFALTNDDTHLVNILKHLSLFWFAIFNIIYFLSVFLIFKSLLKKYKFFEFNDMKKSISILKLVLIGYFLGSITVLGNSFITVLFINILK